MRDEWLEQRNAAIRAGTFRTASLLGPYSMASMPMPKKKKRTLPNDDEDFFEEGDLQMQQEKKKLRKYFRP